jgi:4-amino-4-deoxy-L-arabinose transferase-like glycosyltransferase
LVVSGVALRFLFVCLAGAQQLTFHSGGSDAPSYVLLAQNLLAHLGFAYDGFPSAVRPPGYPLLLAAAMSIFGAKYILAMRILQFVIGLCTVFICAAAARRLCGVAAARASLLAGLFLPTLLFTTAQLLTECLATFLTALFLYQLVLQREDSDARSAATLGWTAGLESMLRFNAGALPLFGAFAVFTAPDRKTSWRRAALALGIPLLIVLPWLIRNEIVFRGEVLYSTQGGPNAVQGVLTSQGRTQPGDSDVLVRNLGWELHQVETNDASRASLPSEAVLDRAALRAVPALWAREGWHAAPLLVKKLGDFWLSLDQIADTHSLPLRERLVRVAGVLCYWMVLLFAIAGWRLLRRTNVAVARLLLIYAAGFTLLHLPLVMNTRLRIPLLEPLFVILAGVGCVGLAPHFPHLRRLIASAASTPASA